MMTVAISASSSFASPLSHPAHLLVMGPGGYRFGRLPEGRRALTIVTICRVRVAAADPVAAVATFFLTAFGGDWGYAMGWINRTDDYQPIPDPLDLLSSMRYSQKNN